jgi:hypothetical protein
MSETTDTRTLDVTPLHRDLYTAVAVGGLADGRRRGVEAINARWHHTETAINQMLDLARSLDDPYIASRLHDLKDDKRRFYTKVLGAFKKRFDSAREMVESDSVEFDTRRRDGPLKDHRPLGEFAPDAERTMFAVAYDDYGRVRSQYSVGFVNGTPIVPTGDTVNRPHVILEKYALAHAIVSGPDYSESEVRTPLLA